MPRILLIEDDEQVRVLMEHVLIRDGYAVDATSTVAAARSLLSSWEYDLVLTDGALPDGSGLAVADEAERRDIPVMVLTGYAFRFPKRELARYDLLLKPV